MIFWHGNLSSHATNGDKACSAYNDDAYVDYLQHRRKTYYIGYKRFLSIRHKYIFQKKAFDGCELIYLDFGIKWGLERLHIHLS